ncbi:hypothetical protein B566_EDAN017296 [Ephemera danica]|nr:hypothetical protein B566_EDAN017296 [Ephemera danica]
MALPDAPLAAFAFLTKAVSVTTKALAPKPWVLYLGKVFSLASSLDALTPIAASPLYTLVYNETFHVMPGAFFLVSAVIFVIDIVFIVSVIHYKFPASNNYVLVSQESAAIQ